MYAVVVKVAPNSQRIYMNKKMKITIVALVVSAVAVVLKTYFDVELPAGLSETLTDQLVEIM